MEQDKVYMDENSIIFIEATGYQTYDVVKFVESECKKCMMQLRDKKRLVRIFIDLNKVTGHNIGGRKAGFELLKTLSFDRIAMIVPNMMLKYVVTLIMKASGKQDKIRLFKSREDAMSWLNDPLLSYSLRDKIFNN